eukprot:scaffold319532_cov28-Tisochrysis_lutea.AAC.1
MPPAAVKAFAYLTEVAKQIAAEIDLLGARAVVKEQLYQGDLEVRRRRTGEGLVEGGLHHRQLSLFEQVRIGQDPLRDISSPPAHHEAQELRVLLLLAHCLLNDFDPVLVTRIERAVARLVDVDVEPRHLASVVARLKAEHRRKAARAVEVHRGRLHPRIIRVARVVHVATIDLAPVALCEELVEHALEHLLLDRVGHRACLLRELTPHCKGDGLARVHHAARQGPLARVLALDRDHLKLVRPGVEARDDWIGGVIGPPLAEQPAAFDAGAAARVERATEAVKADGALEADARLMKLVRDGAGVGGVGPALLDSLGEHRIVGEVERGVLWVQRRPRHLGVRHIYARLVLRVLARACDVVRIHGMGHLLHPIAVRGVEVGEARLGLRIHVEPDHVACM